LGRELVRDPEKWAPVFGKDHAQTKKSLSGSSRPGYAATRYTVVSGDRRTLRRSATTRRTSTPPASTRLIRFCARRTGSPRRAQAQGGLAPVGPAAIGVAAARFGLSDALALAATSYVPCLVALLFLPETRGKPLSGKASRCPDSSHSTAAFQRAPQLTIPTFADLHGGPSKALGSGEDQYGLSTTARFRLTRTPLGTACQSRSSTRADTLGGANAGSTDRPHYTRPKRFT
jgi:hypothetical protein